MSLETESIVINISQQSIQKKTIIYMHVLAEI